jgi:hypothetical protein
MKTIVIILLCMISLNLIAQPARDMTAPEVAFANKVSNALLNSLPKEFKGWDAQIPEYKTAVVGETRCSTCDYGKDCFWNYGFHVIFDGTSQQGPDYDSFRDSMKHTAFDWHYAALMSRYTNTHSITIEISVNDTRVDGNFKYCSSGYKTLPPPAGFDHYYLASVSSCFPKEAQGTFLDVNLYTMKMAPRITPHQETGFVQGDIFFPLPPSTPLKVQELTLRIFASKEVAKEFISKMNIEELKKLFN